MTTVHFHLPDGCEQVINMSEVPHNELQETIKAIAHDLRATSYNNFTAK